MVKLAVAVPISASVKVTEPAVSDQVPTESAANVGLDAVAMLCGRDSVTDPVEADTDTLFAVPVSACTPAFVTVRMFVPEL